MSYIFISIIVPVYNVQDYIQECFDSVVHQTYDGAVECIIVDDCGTDESIAIANSFIKTYNGPVSLRIVSHKK